MKNIDLLKVHLAPIYFLEIPLKPHRHQIQVWHRQDRQEQLYNKINTNEEIIHSIIGINEIFNKE